LRAAAQSADGTVGTLVGVEVNVTPDAGVGEAVGIHVPDVTGATDNFAIKTGTGKVHLGDVLEFDQLSAEPSGQSGTVQVYARTDGNLYQKSGADPEVLLGTQVVDVPIIAGESLGKGDFVSVDPANGRAYKMDIDDASTSTGSGMPQFLRGFVVDASISFLGTGTMRVSGILDGFSGLTAGETLWASLTAGSITATKPTLVGSQRCITRGGVAVSSTELMVKLGPRQFMEQVTSLMNLSTFTIFTPSESPPWQRKIYGYFVISDGVQLGYYPVVQTGSNVSGFFSEATHWMVNDTQTKFQNRSGGTASVIGVVELP